jgi:cytochrome P450
VTVAVHTFEELAEPPTLKPPERALSTFRFFVAMVRNPITVWPKEVCEAPIFLQEVAGKTIAFVMHPDLLKVVFDPASEVFAKNPLEDRLYRPLMGDGILTSQGELWRGQRRAAAPLFRPSALICQVPNMVAAADRTIGKWREAGPESIQLIDPAMMRATFEVVSQALLPDDGNFAMGDIERWTTEYLAGSSWDIVYAMLKLPRWMPHPRRRRALAAARNIRSALGQLIERRLREPTARDDLLGRLLAAPDPTSGCPMASHRILDNVITFLIAGHETTYSTLTWAIYLLARSPEWQRKLRDEANAVTLGRPVTYEHLDKLLVCRQVLKEAMRLYPPAPILSRVCTNRVELGGRHFAPGTMFFVPIYAIHRHRRLWADPDAFDPSRFDEANEAAHSRYAFMPWGAGPRVCIGAAFSMMEATVILTTLAQNAWFSLTTDPEPSPLARITLRPKEAIRLNVKFADRAA